VLPVFARKQRANRIVLTLELDEIEHICSIRTKPTTTWRSHAERKDFWKL
jgi:hypothetical protein